MLESLRKGKDNYRFNKVNKYILYITMKPTILGGITMIALVPIALICWSLDKIERRK